jgi:class 3 adenylate cyclase
VEKFVGDAVLAVFGIPVIHEDDAVRAAHDLNLRLAALSEELTQALERYRVKDIRFFTDLVGQRLTALRAAAR